MYNTKKKSIIAKLGCTAAHRKALLAIYSNQTHNNLILEEDAELMSTLPLPPTQTCYMGGWIVPPLISKTGKVKVDLTPRSGLNKIDYDKFKIITTHALFIKSHEEATELLDMTIEPEQLKPYDIFLAGKQFFKAYYYPSVFVQSQHRSEISHTDSLNHVRTYNYGLTKPPSMKGTLSKKTKRKKHKGGKNNLLSLKLAREVFTTCDKKCSKYKELSKRRFKCYIDCEKGFKKEKGFTKRWHKLDTNRLKK